MFKRIMQAGLVALLLAAPGAQAGKPETFDRDISLFVSEMAEQHGFDKAELAKLLAGARYRQKIIDAITRPAEGMSWERYRPIFVTDSRASEGVEFWNRHQRLLEQAQQKYGVPPEIIVAIIGVETRYGRHAGSYPVIDALATLAFGYPRRADFFRRQLEEFLLLSREEKVNPASATGSYAGAMGQPQFIPSSYRSYAVDFDGNGQRDLWNSTADVIGSVAAYFKRHGWRPGERITLRVEGAGRQHDRFVEAGMKPSIKLGELKTAGIGGDTGLGPERLASLIRLEGREGDEYWLGLDNFYVITRYNHSNLYAMAVYQLSREILSRHTTEERGVEGK
jgi:membrane-bound lytic murein transglycosylase B